MTSKETYKDRNSLAWLRNASFHSTVTYCTPFKVQSPYTSSCLSGLTRTEESKPSKVQSPKSKRSKEESTPFKGQRSRSKDGWFTGKGQRPGVKRGSKVKGCKVTHLFLSGTRQTPPPVADLLSPLHCTRPRAAPSNSHLFLFMLRPLRKRRVCLIVLSPLEAVKVPLGP